MKTFVPTQEQIDYLESDINDFINDDKTWWCINSIDEFNWDNTPQWHVFLKRDDGSKCYKEINIKRPFDNGEGYIEYTTLDYSEHGWPCQGKEVYKYQE